MENRPLEFVQGEFLSPEQRVLVEAAAQVLRQENRLRALRFWGRVGGVLADYFVLQGHTADCFRNVKYFYSHDLLEWFKMPRVEPEAVRLMEDCTALFTGVPSHVFTFHSPTDQRDVQLKEEDRLTATVIVINKEMSVIPRGAFLLGCQNRTVRNKAFKGVPFDKCRDADSYIHFEDLRGAPVLFPLLNSRHTIDADFPPAWDLKVEQDGGVVVLRNRLWPGLTFHHQPDTPFYGWTYFGDGRRNWDFCSMI